MHCHEKCLLESFELHRSPSGGVMLDLAISVWEASSHVAGEQIILHFIISPMEASELAVALAAAASAEVP